MNPSGKSASNPFQLASKPAGEKSGTISLGHVSLPEKSRTALYRGISRVGTENRLVQMPMRRAATLSALFHALAPVVLAMAVVLVMLLLNINIWDWFKDRHTPADLEFTLVNDTQATRPDHPKFKGNFNQRAGGKTNKNQPLKALEDTPSAPAKKGSPPQPTAQTEPKETAPPQAAPTKPTPLKPESRPKLTNAISTPKPPEPAAQQTSSSASQMPAPSGPTSPTQLATIGSPNGDAFAGAGASDAALGNPQDGHSNTPGVDVAQDVNFGPFMADLERRIKRNWVPPRGRESRKVLLLFYLTRDGHVFKVETRQTSGDEDADRAAIAAVQASAPFMPFPPQVKEDILPVEFTFDYNVLNPKNAKRGLKW